MSSAPISAKLVLLGDTNVGKSCLVVRFARGEYFDYQVRSSAQTARHTYFRALRALSLASYRAAAAPPPRSLQEPTIGAAFLTQTVPLDDVTIRFELWDTAGQGASLLSAALLFPRASPGRAAPRRAAPPTLSSPPPHPAAASPLARPAERYRSLAPMYYRGASAAVVVYDVTSRDSFEGAKSWVKELQRRGDPNVVIALAGNKADVREGRLVSAEEARDYAAENNIISLDTSAKTGLNVKEIFVQIAKRLPRTAKSREKDAVADLAAPKEKPAAGGCCGGSA